MAVNLYSGTPGSGKSLRAAYKLIEWLFMGRGAIANFPIDESYFYKKKHGKLVPKKMKIGKFTYMDNESLTVDYLMQYARDNHVPFKERQTLLIIDECASMFNSRDVKRSDRAKWIQFFQQHRKLGYEIILISQSDRLIDRQIRAFIEMEYKHRAMKNYKTFGWILSLLCGGLFQCSEFWYGVNIKTNGFMFLLNRKKAKIYDSFKIFGSEVLPCQKQPTQEQTEEPIQEPVPSGNA